MGIGREEGIVWGTIYFICAFVFVAAGLAYYVGAKTKDRSQAADNRIFTVALTFMAFICMYTMWVCTFLMQMYPIIQPTRAAP